MKLIIKKDKPVFGAIIVAAGKSSRMEGVNKQLLEINGIPALVKSILAFQNSKQIEEIIVVCREDMMNEILNMVYDYELDKVVRLVNGGETRQQSVFKGINELREEITHCIIHDGARPFVSQEVINRCINDVIKYKAVTAAVKVKDTIKQSNIDGFIAKTVDRENLYITQTPQMFEMDLYKKAMQTALQSEKDFTDDCQLIENIGEKVYLSKGDYLNIKITTPEDIILGAAIASVLA